MWNDILFYVVIFLANIIQGITGFAGTILAMPFSVMLVGGDVARPVLNVLGMLSGIYVFAGNRKAVQKKELGRILLFMIAAMAAGIALRFCLTGKENILYLLLGVFVIVLAIQGLVQMKWKKEKPSSKAGDDCLLLGAGLAHGLFVCGGPLLIGYLTKRIKDKNEFRATISCVWIVLNGIILISDMISGCFTASLIRTQFISIPFLLGGMFVGGKIYKQMSQKAFMIITYVLLLISGISLLMK